MTNAHSFGHFLEYSCWENALKLLNLQIDQKKHHRHYNTLAMFCYENLGQDVDSLKSHDYFDQRITNNLFYGLQDEFKTIWYTVPKSNLTLRRFAYLTYPLRATYYAVGLYLMKVSQEFSKEQRVQQPHIQAYYGGGISFEGETLCVNSNNVYFMQYYKGFRNEIKKEALRESKYKLVIQLDIANYFNELSVDHLLLLLEKNIKTSVKTRLRYDADTIEQIRFFFRFVMHRNIGIPVANNDIVSAFVGNLYLSFADLFINDLINNDAKIVSKHSILRYMDDIYISITFHESVDKQTRANYANTIASAISDALHYKMDLRLNAKSKFYWLDDPADIETLLRNLKKVSPKFVAPEKDDDDPQIKVDQLFLQLDRLKEMEPRCIYEINLDYEEEILKNVFDKTVDQMLYKAESQVRLEEIFSDFNFELVKLCPLELIILILKTPLAAEGFKNFLLSKCKLTTYDTDMIIHYLCQTGFQDSELMEKLKSDAQLGEVIGAYLYPRLRSDKPGYFDLDWDWCKQVASSPLIIDQIRLRRSAEISGTWSVALNHLLNEIHAICWTLEQPANKSLKNYDVNEVVNFLNSKKVASDALSSIRNLFDRRNNNLVSHPSTEYGGSWAVSENDYMAYHKSVGQCLERLVC